MVVYTCAYHCTSVHQAKRWLIAWFIETMQLGEPANQPHQRLAEKIMRYGQRET
jgi:hypothetical protein